MGRPRTRSRWMAAVVLLCAALLLGADCPHCTSAGRSDASASSPVPSCHESVPAPVAADSSEAEPTPAMDCGCPDCELDARAVSFASAADLDRVETWLFAHPDAFPSPGPRRRSVSDWTPPPYPGFADNTVILLS